MRCIAAPSWIGVYSRMTFKWHHTSLFYKKRFYMDYSALGDTGEYLLSVIIFLILFILLNKLCRFKSVEFITCFL